MMRSLSSENDWSIKKLITYTKAHLTTFYAILENIYPRFMHFQSSMLSKFKKKNYDCVQKKIKIGDLLNDHSNYMHQHIFI